MSGAVLSGTNCPELDRSGAELSGAELSRHGLPITNRQIIFRYRRSSIGITAFFRFEEIDVAHVLLEADDLINRIKTGMVRKEEIK